jgi:hypothetical protein
VFVTSTLYTGDLGGIAGADAICNQRAQAANLPGTYMAWISTVADSPANRFTKSQVPYVETNGWLVALDWNDLIDNSLNLAIARTELGQVSPNTGGMCENSVRLARTGTNPDGTQGPNICNNFTSANPNYLGTVGRTTSPTGSWSNCNPGACDIPMPIYCFQQ